MKTLVVTLLLVINGICIAQYSKNSFTPSVYYTSGNYSNENSSKSMAAYATLELKSFNSLTAGFDNLQIDNPFWDYKQNMFVISGIKNWHPFYLKASYVRIIGDFSSRNIDYTYEDITNVYYGEILLNVAKFYFGAGYTNLSFAGLNQIDVNSIKGKIVFYPSPNLGFTINNLFTDVTDGRKLYSSDLGITYSVNKNITLDGNVLIGERAYYYNSDLLTIFNQNETQKKSYKLKVSVNLFKNLKLKTSYNFTEFSNYNINYFSVGFGYEF